MKKESTTIQDICMIGVMTAVMCVMAQISIPMPLGIPMTMQTFAVALAGIILGSRKGGITLLVYVLIGAIGLPVFSNFTGGYQCLVGLTGGFILSFPVMAFLIGLGAEYQSRWKGSLLVGILLGNAVNYLFGTAMYCFLGGNSFVAGLLACVVPFLPVTVVKMALAWVVGMQVKRRIPVLSKTRVTAKRAR